MAARPLSSCCLAVLALFTLGACAEAPSNPVTSAADERSLFVEASKDIIEFHIKAVLPDQIAMDGLSQLAVIDPQLSVERSGGEIVLRRGALTRAFDAPDPSATAKWGAVTEAVLSAARKLSPDVAALSSDRIDEMIIDASLAQLDPFSRYARPAVAREHRAARDGFAGIGITLDIHESDVRIASVMPETPAAIAGLIAGDRIVALDGIPVADLTADDIRGHLRGPVQTLVQLAVARGGVAEPLQVTIQRANIVPETVTLKEDGGLAWLKLRAFNQQTAQSLADLLQQAHRDLGPDLHGIVLDLRDNPGGLLDQSIDVASLFLDGGDIISTTGRNPQSQQHFAAPEDHSVETLPMVVLINGGSASASEIVAAALQDSDRAVVVGTSSFGKGTVQTVLRTANDGELTVTWAQIVTPRGYFLNTHGVVPTVCTAASSGAGNADALLSQTPPVPTSLAQPRDALDDAGWIKLRALCPPDRLHHDSDSVVASRLLDNPALYGRVLASMEAPRVAANP
jgi:carboxyl-terminal processing protease